MNILTIDEIVSDPSVRGGRPVIRGTGITVMNIVHAHTSGDRLSFDEIASQYQVSLGQVMAAVAYYYLHQAEMDAAFQQEVEETDVLIAELEREGKLSRLD
ncbi:MAG: DUF433 domain-containing protein [Anaerolineae bacterium]|nr:DUF433 domain-containing protein [Anaerolineae bacterium]